MSNNIPRPEHPRPDFQRAHWLNLNGRWSFDFDPDSVGEDEKWYSKNAHNYGMHIIVPFPWESELSEVHDTEYKGAAWYQRTISVPKEWESKRVVLKFGAVDWEAKVWINDNLVGSHEGGYSAFEFDITDYLAFGGEDTITVRAFDVTHPEVPSGKQTGWYTTTSGIWQTVYLEARGNPYIERVHITPDLANSMAHFHVNVESEEDGDFSVCIESGDVATEQIQLNLNSGRNRLFAEVSIPEPKLWTPENPNLYNVAVRLTNHNGEEVDAVKTYFGMREVSRGKYGAKPYEYVLLNGKPIYLMGALCQSFNPQGIYTYPSDEYIKNDMLKTKEFGFNFLRIHIKVDEPRVLYWADVVGVMLMCDMPNFAHYTEESKKNWEMTLRDAIDRDINHPSIIAWCDFNETWGIGHGGYTKEHQDWVEEAYLLTKKLDPTRLVEENSPCRYDHVATDINSWHFYIDDYEATRKHIADAVEQVYPGSPFNYVEGKVQGTEPFINSEYGAVSAGGGDRDIAWGFKYQTTLMRSHEKIGGYVYTELTDIEWEHNGFMNYDRRVKDFGYGEVSPDFSYRDLNNLDFLVIDSHPCPTCKPGSDVTIDLAVSHFSEREVDNLTLKWRFDKVDVFGKSEMYLSGIVPAEWEQYCLKKLPPLNITLPDEQCIGTLTVWLEDESGQRLAANYINFDVYDEPAPRVEVHDAKTCSLRFSPGEYHKFQWDKFTPVMADKAFGYGAGCFEYQLAMPEGIDVNALEEIELIFEAAAKADGEKVDWPSRRKPVDYPQTDDKKYPTDVTVSVNGVEVDTIKLSDDPADARGKLSHNAKFHHGSYGFLTNINIDLGKHPEIRDKIASDQKITLQFAVKPDAENKGGFALFGERLGGLPIAPTIRLKAKENIGLQTGYIHTESIAIDPFSARQKKLLVTAEAGGAIWRYATEEPAEDWMSCDFDDSDWQQGTSGFGRSGTPGAIVRTNWHTNDIYLRWRGDVPKIGENAITNLRYHHDEDMEVYINGKLLFTRKGYITEYADYMLSSDESKLLVEGENVIAVHCHQTTGGQYVDVGLTVMED